MTEEPVRILIVDDHRENLVTLEAILAPLGHEIRTAESGRAALKLLLHEEIALILLDVAMPDVDGYEVADLIRRRPANRDTPIIFLTANSKSQAAMFKGYSVGAVDYILKPFAPDVLVSKVTVFVELYRRSRSLQRQADDLRRAHDELDLRVRERTSELAAANERLKTEILQRRRAERERTELLDREREARQEAERSNRTKDQFLATLSHELRTPLNAIVGWAHILETTSPDEATVARGMRAIKHNALAQKQLIEDILDVSRIINGRMLLNVAAVDVPALIERALETVRPAAEAKRISVVPRLHDVPRTTGDPDRLQQVAWNLLSNAIKFTPKDGRVEVDLDVQEGDLRLTVRDTGRGIPAAFLPYIFDRFSQADSSVTRTHGGLGLGMAIVRHLVELHGGTVHAESGGEGRGAAFTVTLPVRECAATPDSAVAGAPDPVEPDVAQIGLPRLDGLAILVVDNESDARDIASAILRHQGAAVETAASGPEALQLLSSTAVDVIVSDIAMPGMDGYEMLRRIRGSSLPARDVPAVALSAHASHEAVAAAMEAGYQCHVAKPLEAAVLIRAVAVFTGIPATPHV